MRRPSFENRRFAGGIITTGGSVFSVVNNDDRCVELDGTYPLQVSAAVTLYDDDDYDSNNGTLSSPLHGDIGENVEEIPNKTFALMRPSDLAGENVYAPAYITPEYYEMSVRGWNNSNVPFALNVPNNNQLITAQLTLGLDSGNVEGDDFWVAYVQLAYQGDLTEDGDGDFLPNGIQRGSGGVTLGAVGDNATGEQDVPRGGDGSLIYLEASRDLDATRGWAAMLKLVPHEIGHQFGLRGDNDQVVWGIMNAVNGPFSFQPEHLNMLRWRVKSPGQQ